MFDDNYLWGKFTNINVYRDCAQPSVRNVYMCVIYSILDNHSTDSVVVTVFWYVQKQLKHRHRAWK